MYLPDICILKKRGTAEYIIPKATFGPSVTLYTGTNFINKQLKRKETTGTPRGVRVFGTCSFLFAFSSDHFRKDHPMRGIPSFVRLAYVNFFSPQMGRRQDTEKGGPEKSGVRNSTCGTIPGFSTLLRNRV